MSADIGPGTPLICIAGCVWESGKLTEGALYFCKEIVAWNDESRMPPGVTRSYNCGFCTKTGHDFIVVKDQPNGEFCPARFRPLNDGDTSLVEDCAGLDLALVTAKTLENV